VRGRHHRDQTIRRRPGERLDHLFAELAAQRPDSDPHSTAVEIVGERSLTFRELDARANRLARHLREDGVGPGERVALLLDHPLEAHTGMLAVLECNAAYVPLDAGFPPDRIAHIVSDSGARTAVIPSHLRELIPDEVGAVEVDTGSDALGIRPGWPAVLRRGRDPDGRAGYLIYTSGTTGRPEGCGGRALGDLQLRPGRGRAPRITSGSGSCSPCSC
jgi:non-ribosomal peptide synthetase component F